MTTSFDACYRAQCAKDEAAARAARNKTTVQFDISVAENAVAETTRRSVNLAERLAAGRQQMIRDRIRMFRSLHNDHLRHVRRLADTLNRANVVGDLGPGIRAAQRIAEIANRDMRSRGLW